jgi:GNAT superfamily N-acetyltransferase
LPIGWWCGANAWRGPIRTQSPIVAELEGAMVGFAHTIFDDDPKWGALLDNLHVNPDVRRRGVGGQLMAGTAEAVLARSQPTGLYLWVLEQNVDAQAFYARCRGTQVDTKLVSAPGGVAGRLNGAPNAFRIVWPDPSVLLSGSPGPRAR